jgi:hypothetical protein
MNFLNILEFVRTVVRLLAQLLDVCDKQPPEAGSVRPACAERAAAEPVSSSQHGSHVDLYDVDTLVQDFELIVYHTGDRRRVYSSFRRQLDNIAADPQKYGLDPFDTDTLVRFGVNRHEQ